MATTMSALDDSVVVKAAGRHSTRFCYTKIENRSLKFVIADFSQNSETWSEQESGEIRWYPFTPSQAERSLVRSWFETGRTILDWSRITSLL